MIVHYRQRVALAGEPEDRQEKISATRAINPAAAKNQVHAAAALNFQFSRALRAAINAERVRGVIFRVRAALAIKHVVGRVMNEPGIEVPRRPRERPRSFGIDARSECFIRLRGIHGSVRRGVDDDLGPHTIHKRAQRVELAEIGVFTVAGDNGSGGLEAPLELPSNLPGAAEEQDLFQSSRSRY